MKQVKDWRSFVRWLDEIALDMVPPSGLDGPGAMPAARPGEFDRPEPTVGVDIYDAEDTL